MKWILIALLVLIVGCTPVKIDEATALKITLTEQAGKIDNLEKNLVKLEADLTLDIVGIKGQVTGIEGDITGIKGNVTGVRASSDTSAEKIDELRKQILELQFQVTSSSKQIAENKSDMGDLKESVVEIGNQTNDTGGVWVYATVATFVIVIALAAVGSFYMWIRFRKEKGDKKAFSDILRRVASGIKNINGEECIASAKASIKDSFEDDKELLECFEGWLNGNKLYARKE